MRCFFAPISASYAAAGVLLRLIRERKPMEEQINSVKQAGETRKSLLAAFLKECYVVDFLQEYGKDSGIAERWGICTRLSADSIEEKYGEIVDRYRPYMVIPRGKTNPFAEYHTNEEKFKKRLFRDDAYGFNDLTEYYHPELVMDLESELELKMFCRHIYDCLPKLTEKQRRVFSLRYSAQLSIGEIAEKQNLTRQAVYALLRGAKNRIREALSHKYPPEFLDGVEKGRVVRG